MRSLMTFTLTIFATHALLVSAVSAHHSQAMFDGSQELLIEGTVARFDWTNPHMYLIVDTTGPDGKPAQVEGEGLSITQARVNGLRREALQPGTPVIMRVNPNRGGAGKQVRILDVTTTDGEIHLFYTANDRNRRLTPAVSLAGQWAPRRQTPSAVVALSRWPLTPQGRAAEAQLAGDGLCGVEPIPLLAVVDEMRSIEIGSNTIVLHFDNSGEHVLRMIHINAEHPIDVQPSLHGHSVGRWEGDTLVVDTIAFEPHSSGLGLNVPSSPGKHTVERLSLTADRTQLSYQITVEDPVYLMEPSTLLQQWDHRPDLAFSPAAEACDPEVATRYRNQDGDLPGLIEQ